MQEERAGYFYCFMCTFSDTQTYTVSLVFLKKYHHHQEEWLWCHCQERTLNNKMQQGRERWRNWEWKGCTSPELQGKVRSKEARKDGGGKGKSTQYVTNTDYCRSSSIWQYSLQQDFNRERVKQSAWLAQCNIFVDIGIIGQRVCHCHSLEKLPVSTVYREKSG